LSLHQLGIIKGMAVVKAYFFLISISLVQLETKKINVSIIQNSVST